MTNSYSLWIQWAQIQTSGTHSRVASVRLVTWSLTGPIVFPNRIIWHPSRAGGHRHLPAVYISLSSFCMLGIHWEAVLSLCDLNNVVFARPARSTCPKLLWDIMCGFGHNGKLSFCSWSLMSGHFQSRWLTVWCVNAHHADD